jgi:phosphate starvation-inducible PhoH-like protein
MRTWTPKTANQEKYLKALLNRSKPVLIVIGPAGTGKTYLACQIGAEQIINNNKQYLITTRPTKAVDEDHGYLPGDINKKLAPWLQPIFDSLEKNETSRQMMEKSKLRNKLLIAPFAYMRGRTFDNAWIVADEMQNATPAQTKMLLTRLGEDSKLIINGDINQCDLPNSGLKDFLSKLKIYGFSNYIDVIELTKEDVIRSPAVKEILEIYEC